MKTLLILFLRAYRAVISPVYGQVCRYYPSCSAYALESVEVHGALRGAWLALRRLSRCHPWTSGGVDEVPSRSDYRWWGIAPGYDGEDDDREDSEDSAYGRENSARSCDDRGDMMAPTPGRGPESLEILPPASHRQGA